MEALSTDSMGGTLRASKRLSMLDTAHLRASLYRDSASDCTLRNGLRSDSLVWGVSVRRTAHTRCPLFFFFFALSSAGWSFEDGAAAGVELSDFGSMGQ